jgi:hypothetical protein
MTFESFEHHHSNYQQMQEITPASIGIRKKVRLFMARREGRLSAIVALEQKSRVVLKDVVVLESIVEKMEHLVAADFTAKVLLMEAPLCSKARRALEEQGWDIL